MSQNKFMMSNNEKKLVSSILSFFKTNIRESPLNFSESINILKGLSKLYLYDMKDTTTLINEITNSLN